MADSCYMEIRKFRDAKMKQASHNHIKLNQLHDEIMNKVIHFALKQTAEKLGPLPCPFSFFVMGSAAGLNSLSGATKIMELFIRKIVLKQRFISLNLEKKYQRGYSKPDILIVMAG